MSISDWSADVCSSDLSQTQEPSCVRGSLSRMPPWPGYPCSLTSPGSPLCVSDEPMKPMCIGLTPSVSRSARPSARMLRAMSSGATHRSEEHTSELQSLMRISYAVFCLKKKHTQPTQNRDE